MSDMNIEDKTIEHYATLIIIMKEKINIDISQETADKIMYEWLTDKEVRKYLNDNNSSDLDIMKIHEDISSVSKNIRFSYRLSPVLRYLKENPDTLISFNKKNPKRSGSISKQRYENYKSSTTYNEFKERGGTGSDITYDFDRGYLVIHSELAPKPKYIKNKVEDDL